ncbi:MAG: rRNA maturation RNase YbeY [Bacillus subtilis]|nr:rRNA maturation RNase YbeY [Bacillus subtilis]
MLKINLVNQTSEVSPLFTKIIFRTMRQSYRTLKLRGRKIINVILTTNEGIHEINKNYRHVDKPTDVISFENTDSEIELGDVFISLDKTHAQAAEYGHTFERELAFLAVHGFLHCAGYDHLTLEEESVMFALQDQILDICRIPR